MTAPTPALVNLLDVLTEGRELPEGYDSWGIKSTRPDLRTRDNFRWPFPGNSTERYELSDYNGSCPLKPGDGLCVATTWAGMASGGFPARTLLLVAYRSAEVRGDEPGKLRVPQAFVVDLIDGEQLLRDNGKGANLRGANLRYADLRGAGLQYVNLQGANLQDAHLRGSHLQGANLQGANLQGANLQGANLRDAGLRYANLQYANLRDADLQGSDLQGANLRGSNLQYANLQGSNLQGSNLQHAVLQYANLRRADLQGANLYGANMQGAFGVTENANTQQVEK